MSDGTAPARARRACRNVSGQPVAKLRFRVSRHLKPDLVIAHPRKENSFNRSSPRRTQVFTVPSGSFMWSAQLRVRQAVKKREHDALALLRFQLLQAAASAAASPAAASRPSARGVLPASTAISHSSPVASGCGRRSQSRERLRTMLVIQVERRTAARVVRRVAPTLT